MEHSSCKSPSSSFKTALSVLVLLQLSSIAYGQTISTPCTSSMINSFTPCLSYVTGSAANGSGTPTTECCTSLKDLVGASMDCACLLVTASVPLPLNINRNLALNLPGACRSAGVSGVPVQCKASGSPLPAPGPAALGPSSSSAFTPQSSKAAGLSPEADPEALSPADAEAPSTPAGLRPFFTPSGTVRLTAASLPVFVLIFVSSVTLRLY